MTAPTPTSAPIPARTGDAPSQGEWLTIAEAAMRLGVRSSTIRSRIKRKTIETRPGRASDDGLVRVWVAAPEAASMAAPGPAPGAAPAGTTPAMPPPDTTALQAELARVQAERDGLAARLADRDRALEQARTEQQALHAIIERRDREAERMQV